MPRIPETNNDGNGLTAAPEPVERETTGRLRANMASAIRDAGSHELAEGTGDPIDRLTEAMGAAIEHAVEKFGGGEGPRGGPPSSMTKKNRWLQVLAMTLGATAAGGASYGVLSATVHGNKETIEKHEAKPMHDTAAAEFSGVKIQVQAVEQKLGDVEKKLGPDGDIVQGLKDLKQENIDRLKRDNERLENELARERRRNR